MDLREILAISGKSGLFKIEANRDNGLIASELGSTKKSFYSSRTYMFTPLENITIYTQLDSIELKDVFEKIKKDESLLIKPKSSAKELREFFKKIIPEHDEEKVYTNDIKKIIKWYNSLKEHGLLESDAKKEEEGDVKEVKNKSTKKAVKKKVQNKVAKPRAQNIKKVEKRGSQRGN